MPNHILKQVNKLIFHFIWNGKTELNNRQTLCKPKSQGGLGVVQLQYKLQAFLSIWIKRFLLGENRKMAIFL